jgi:hypothetical protein
VSYQDNLKQHLADYKRLTLGISEPGIFAYRGRSLPMHHILPRACASKNLLEEANSAASAFLLANPGKRHRYFHHLNSSQAFAFNLFFPYFSGSPESASVLLRALGQNGTLDEWRPEATPFPEEETNIDVFWKTTDGTKNFCEVKLSETDFGKAHNDARHIAKLTNFYRQILSDHMVKERLEPTAFFQAYQFNRNVWHMVREDHSRLLFLLPRANTSLWRLLQELLSGVAVSTLERIAVIAIEDVITRLLKDANCPAGSRAYARKLGLKYLPLNVG